MAPARLLTCVLCGSCEGWQGSYTLVSAVVWMIRRSAPNSASLTPSRSCNSGYEGAPAFALVLWLLRAMRRRLTI